MREQINRDWMMARRERQGLKASILGIVRSDALLKAKEASREVTDEDYLAACKSNYKGIKSAIDDATKAGIDESKLADYKSTLAILEAYMPKVQDAEATTSFVQDAITNGAVTIKDIMSMVSASDLEYDKKLVSKIAGDLLKTLKKVEDKKSQ